MRAAEPANAGSSVPILPNCRRAADNAAKQDHRGVVNMFERLGPLDPAGAGAEGQSAATWLPSDESVDDAAPRTLRAQAVKLLTQRGFVYAGEDAVGLPCFRSPSGAILIGVGSCRCLAYAKVQGRLQVVAAARTAALLCRIDVEAQPAPARVLTPEETAAISRIRPRPEPVLVV